MSSSDSYLHGPAPSGLDETATSGEILKFDDSSFLPLCGCLLEWVGIHQDDCVFEFESFEFPQLKNHLDSSADYSAPYQPWGDKQLTTATAGGENMRPSVVKETGAMKQPSSEIRRQSVESEGSTSNSGSASFSELSTADFINDPTPATKITAQYSGVTHLDAPIGKKRGYTAAYPESYVEPHVSKKRRGSDDSEASIETPSSAASSSMPHTPRINYVSWGLHSATDAIMRSDGIPVDHYAYPSASSSKAVPTSSPTPIGRAGPSSALLPAHTTPTTPTNMLTGYYKYHAAFLAVPVPMNPASRATTSTKPPASAPVMAPPATFTSIAPRPIHTGRTKREIPKDQSPAAVAKRQAASLAQQARKAIKDARDQAIALASGENSVAFLKAKEKERKREAAAGKK